MARTRNSDGDLGHGRHCVFALHVHLVLITKYRRNQDACGVRALNPGLNPGASRALGDFEWRSNGGFGQAHQARFYKLRSSANNAHVSLTSILEGWMAAERNNRWLRQHLARLLELFRQRNDLAHGRVLQGIAFEPVYESMHQTREKWRAAVSDFRGY